MAAAILADGEWLRSDRVTRCTHVETQPLFHLSSMAGKPQAFGTSWWTPSIVLPISSLRAIVPRLHFDRPRRCSWSCRRRCPKQRESIDLEPSPGYVDLELVTAALDADVQKASLGGRELSATKTTSSNLATNALT